MNCSPLISSLVVLAITVPSAQGTNISFTKIADTSTQIPNGGGNFSGFATTSLDGQDVAFSAKGQAGHGGVYIYKQGTLTRIADTNTPIPGGVGNFTNFSPVSLHNGHVAFVAGGEDQTGIYTNLGGALRPVADANRPIPGGSGNFTGSDQASLDQNQVAFIGSGGYGKNGIYLETNGTVSKVADTHTPIPDGTGNFTSIGATPGSLDNGSVAFRGHGSGVYTNLGGSLVTVADHNTLFPGTTDNFTSFDTPSLDSGTVVFKGDTADKKAIFTWNGGSLTTVVDTSTNMPGGTDMFGAFGNPPSLDGGNVAFEAFGGGQQGIYVSFEGSLLKVIDRSDTLDGKSFNPTYSASFSIFAESLDGSSLAFRARFADGSYGLYVAEIPEPGAMSLVCIGVTGLAVWRRRQR